MSDNKTVKHLTDWSSVTADYISKAADILGNIPSQFQEQIVPALKVLKFYKQQIDTTLSTMKVEVKPSVPLPDNVLPFVPKKNISSVVRNQFGKRALEME